MSRKSSTSVLQGIITVRVSATAMSGLAASVTADAEVKKQRLESAHQEVHCQSRRQAALGPAAQELTAAASAGT